MTDEERATLAELEAELLLPLAVKDKLLGFMSLAPKLSEEPYTSSDLRLLKSVAAQTGLALEVARLTTFIGEEIADRERLSREPEIAREVQERLFPQHLPAVPGIDYCGRCRPAREVRGDYYDFLELPEGRLGIAVGDVSGKGIGAALMMATLEASLRGQATLAGGNLVESISRVKSISIRGVVGEPLRDLLLRAVRSQITPAQLRERRSQSARTAEKCGHSVAHCETGNRRGCERVAQRPSASAGLVFIAARRSAAVVHGWCLRGHESCV
jgi:hypothetical protein